MRAVRFSKACGPLEVPDSEQTDKDGSRQLRGPCFRFQSAGWRREGGR